MLSSSTNRSVHSIVKVHGLRAFARSRPFRRSRRAEFMPSVCHASGASLGLLPSALRMVFYSGSPSSFAVHASGVSLAVLTLKSISHFRLFVKWKVHRFNPFQNQNAIIHLALRIIAHSKLFVKNFFRRREISGFPRLSLNYRTAAMPCLYWFRLCVPLTAVSGRPVSQSVTNSILDGFPSVLCRFRRLRPVNAVRRSVVPPSFHRLSA